MTYIVRIWRGSSLIGYVRSVNSSTGRISKTTDMRNAKKCKTSWMAQEVIDAGTVHALENGWLLEVLPVVAER